MKLNKNLFKIFSLILLSIIVFGTTSCDLSTNTDTIYGELSFYEEDGIQKLGNVTLNKAIIPTVNLESDEEFLGWATTKDASEPTIQSGVDITYNTIKELLVDNKVMLYPVIKKNITPVTYDLEVAIWQETGDEEVVIYITDYEVEVLKKGFLAYLESQSIDTTNLKINYVQQKGISNNEFNAFVNNNSKIDVAVSGANMASESANPSIILDATYGRSKVGADHFGNIKRYTGIVNGHGTNSLAVSFYEFLLANFDATIEITLKGDTEETTVLHSVSLNEATVCSYTAPENKEFAGWSTEQEATEVLLNSDSKINYSTVKAYAINGEVTLYPVFADHVVKNDLVVAVIRGNTSLIITDTDMQLIKEGFNTYLTNLGKNISEITIDWRDEFLGKGVDFVTNVVNASGDVDFVIGASNLIDEGQGLVIYAETEWKNLVNPVITSSSRYCGLNKDCSAEHLDLAQLLFDYLTTKPEVIIELTLIGSETKITNLSSTTLNEATIPALDIPTGKELAGWAKEQNATEVLVSASATLTYNVVKDLAVDGKVTLYPIYKEKTSTDVYTLVVALYTSGPSTEYMTADDIQAIKDGFTTKLTELGYELSKVTITWKEKGGIKVNPFCEYVLAEGDVDVVIAGNNVTSQAAVINAATISEENLYKGVITGVTLSSDSRYVVIVDGSEENTIALALYNFLTQVK